jgi:hypothetical protein
MKELFTLGELYVSDFLKEGEEPRGGKVEMKMMFDENTKEVRLEKAASGDVMYGRYWYRSGINQTMKNELKSIVESVRSVYKLEAHDIWLDIACNDGTLLGFVPTNITRIGVDPVEDSFKVEAEKNADIIVQDYFSKKALIQKAGWNENKHRAKVVTCIAMFYDLEDPDSFLQDVHSVMHKDGLFVCQMSYTPLMIEQMAFDNICHEHIFYYTLYTIKNLFEKNGFKIIDCQLNDINGGSFRVYAMRKDGDVTKFGTQPYRDVCDFRVKSLLSFEKIAGYNDTQIWNIFYRDLQKLKTDVVSFIKQAKAEGKTVWGYGASTKGNTLLQYFGLDHTLIDGMAERSPYKYGLKTVGTNISIYSEEDMRKARPDYLLVLPWHFINEFRQRECEYLQAGGKFIVPCPKFEIIGDSE